MNAIVNVDADRILRERGLGSSADAVRYLASEVKRLSDPYVPMQSGTLKNTAQVTDDSVLYNAPYAHYQYHGAVMAGRAPKHYTGEKLRYHGGDSSPPRGPEWDKRMMADRGDELRESFARHIGGKAK